MGQGGDVTGKAGVRRGVLSQAVVNQRGVTETRERVGAVAICHETPKDGRDMDEDNDFRESTLAARDW